MNSAILSPAVDYLARERVGRDGEPEIVIELEYTWGKDFLQKVRRNAFKSKKSTNAKR